MSMKNKQPSGEAAREYRRAAERPDDANAFIPDTTGQSRPLAAADAESLAEEFIGAATGGDSVTQDAEDEVVEEEEGGPYTLLDDEARLPPEPEERSLAADGREPVQREQLTRGARWAARGV
jgi:hypothetical protein